MSLFSSSGLVQLVLVLLVLGLAVCIHEAVCIQTKKGPEIHGNPDSVH